MLRETAVLSYEAQQARRFERLGDWQAAADSGQVSCWQAFVACWQIRKQILWGWISHHFKKTPGK